MVAPMALVTRSGCGRIAHAVSGCRVPPWVAVCCCGLWLSLHVRVGWYIQNTLENNLVLDLISQGKGGLYSSTLPTLPPINQ